MGAARPRTTRSANRAPDPQRQQCQEQIAGHHRGRQDVAGSRTETVVQDDGEQRHRAPTDGHDEAEHGQEVCQDADSAAGLTHQRMPVEGLQTTGVDAAQP